MWNNFRKVEQVSDIFLGTIFLTFNFWFQNKIEIVIIIIAIKWIYIN
jgi:hypothetical protein